MYKLRTPTLLFAIILAAATGCRTAPWENGIAPAVSANDVVPRSAKGSRMTPTALAESAEAAPAMPPGSPELPKPDAQAMAQVLTELQALSATDPAAYAQFVEDLKATPVELWPGLTQTFKATLAYRQQYQHRLAQQGPNRGALPAGYSHVQQVGYEQPQASDPQQTSPQYYAQSQLLAVEPPQVAEQVPQSPPVAASPAAPASSTVIVASDAAPGTAEATVPQVAPPAEAQAAAPTVEPAAAPAGATVEPAVTAAAATAPAAPTAAASEVQPAVLATPADSAAPPAVQTAAATEEAKPETAAEEKTWQDQLAAAIKVLEASAVAAPTSPQETAPHVSLRLLYLVAGRRDDALRPIPGLSSIEQEFWNKQLYGLAVYVDEKRNEDGPRRTAETMTHLRDALNRLAESASLVVKNLNFCTEVSSYGVFKKFDRYEFTPNQEVILYAEIENFKSNSTEKGYHTALKSSYQILDSQGKRVADQDFALTEEHCKNLRRDFFVRFFVFMPKTIAPGEYTLQLTVEDTNGQKIGQSNIQFSIREVSKQVAQTR